MAAYTLQSSYDTVQVFSASEVVDAIYCVIATAGHGAVVNRTIPKANFGKNGIDVGMLNALATAVDEAIDGGLAVAASGVQDVDDSGLLLDAVQFTVQYVPASPTLGPLTTTVTVPVDVVAADTQFGSFLSGGGSTADRLQAAYANLKTLSGE